VFANSRDVAAFFGKRHDHVLRDINELLTHAPNLGDGLLSGYFTCVQTPHPTVVGRMIPSYDMTRDGFTLLVMGYTGPKAMEFKVRYIQRFNKMEEALKQQLAAPALPTNYRDALIVQIATTVVATTPRIETARDAMVTQNRMVSRFCSRL